MAGYISLAQNTLSTKGKKMKHVNAELLNALAEGKTIQYAYCGPGWDIDHPFWCDIVEEDSALNSVACDLMIAGRKNPEYPMQLRIKPDQE